MDDSSRKRTREIADRHLAEGDALGWFEEVYATAGEEFSAIPWADTRPNPGLVSWLDNAGRRTAGGNALVVGCGLGDDAEELSRRGFAVTAFDISPASIDWCRKRFPISAVGYHAADLFRAPQEWHAGFDFIFEAYTLQSLPADLRSVAMERLAGFLAPGGLLLVVARGRDAHEPDNGPPWPLTRVELATFSTCGLLELTFEDYRDGEGPASRRFRVLYEASSPNA